MVWEFPRSTTIEADPFFQFKDPPPRSTSIETPSKHGILELAIPCSNPLTHIHLCFELLLEMPSDKSLSPRECRRERHKRIQRWLNGGIVGHKLWRRMYRLAIDLGDLDHAAVKHVVDHALIIKAPHIWHVESWFGHFASYLAGLMLKDECGQRLLTVLVEQLNVAAKERQQKTAFESHSPYRQLSFL